MKSEHWNSVEELYHRALDLDEPRRAEFLDHECGEDKSLRRELESLLAHANEAEQFIESPAIVEMGKLLASEMPAAEYGSELIGRVVSHYRVIAKLASGGMGLIYKAEDIRLHRFVVLKFLPENLARDPLWLARFEREAQAASALNHPNICTIYEIGEHENNAFIAMEFLVGQTLQQLIEETAIPTGQILDLSIQIADALEAAHRNGIIHRDLKPANIFISSGHVKLLDFGVAKISGQFAGANNGLGSPAKHLTEAGMALGTAAYMSPEQVRGDELDARTDLFSFGVVLYEMATRDRPFKGKTSGAISAALLHETPASPSLLNPNIPPKLAVIIMKGLEKNRDLRYQKAADVGADLKQVKREIERGEFSAPAHPSSAIGRRMLNMTLSALLVATLAGLFYRFSYRPHYAKPSLTERDTVVLTDFTNQTSDPVFSDALNQAFTVELGQSPFLNVLSERKVADTLRMMGRPANQSITMDIGRELCIRTGSKAVVGGTISSVGSHYLIGLNAVACGTGDTLAREQAEAAGIEDVLKSLSRASSQLRTKLGESLPSVQKYAIPGEATTTSLEALSTYSMGLKLKGNATSIPFLKRAIELDPNFPMAYAGLAIAYDNLRQPSPALEYAEKAYQLRDRVSEKEKLRISAAYFGITGEKEKSIRAYEQWIATYPRDSVPHVNLGVAYAEIGQHDKALAEIEQALQLTPDYPYYSNLGWTFVNLNRLDEANGAFDQALARGQDSTDLRVQIYALAFLQGDTAKMQEQLTWGEGKAGDEDDLLSTQSDTEAYFGRLNRAREFSRRAVDSALRAESKEGAALWQVNAALREAELGNPAAARQGVAAALALSPGRNVKIVAALTLARVGDPKAKSLAQELAKNYPTNTLLHFYWLPTINGAIDLKTRNSSEALAQLESAKPYELGLAGAFVNYLYPAYIRGEAYLLARNGPAAAAEFQKLLNHSGIVTNFVTGALSHLQIGRAYAMSGETAKAKAAYQDFFTLWKDADTDIPILKQAKNEYAKLH